MKIQLSRKKRKILYYLAVLFPFLVFVLSFLLQYILYFMPCVMCRIERYIYLVLFFSLLWGRGFVLALLVSFFGLCIVVYHKLLQIGFVSKCLSFTSEYHTVEEFQYMMQNTLPCSVSSSIFGIEFVWANIVIFSIYCMMCLYILYKKMQTIK
ncbi:MAG: disulfide bond formation protein DsbB [Candidatus Deianiraeaceae bacterium]|jgi:disulfide bond formation protein DsbB